LSQNHQVAADLTQVTFSKVWSSLAKFRGASSVSTWIHRIAYFTYVDWVRRFRPATHQTEDWWHDMPGADPTPSEQSADLETIQQLCRAVDKLPDQHRQAIHLHYYQGLSLTETCEVLEVAESTLKYRLRSALDELRRQFREPANINETAKKDLL
jgi:RNA polymerase sigma-70 factor (ECF subfamily)